jgi:hypothetical protein
MQHPSVELFHETSHEICMVNFSTVVLVASIEISTANVWRVRVAEA